MTEKKKFPKPTGRIGKGLANTLKPVIEDAEVVAEEAPKPKAPEVPETPRWVTVNVSPTRGNHIEINGLNALEVIAVLKGAHTYMMKQLQEELAKHGIEEGPANPASGGDS